MQREQTLDFLSAPAATLNLRCYITMQDLCWAHMCTVHGSTYRQRLTVHSTMDQMLMYCILRNINKCHTALCQAHRQQANEMAQHADQVAADQKMYKMNERTLLKYS